MAGGKAWKVALLVVLHVCAAMGTAQPCIPSNCSCHPNLASMGCEGPQWTTVPRSIRPGTISMRLLRTNITDIPSGAFAQWPQGLRLLNLMGNPLRTIADGVFRNFTRLSFLYLQNNQLQSISAGLFGNLTVLNMLFLDNNQLSSISAGAFSGLRSLQSLGLSSNMLQELPSGIFDDLVRLTNINLEDNPLTSLRPDLFKNNQLNKVYLKGTLVSRGTGLCALMLAHRNQPWGWIRPRNLIDFGTELKLVNCSLASIRCAYTPESKVQRLFCACPKGQTFDGKKCITKSSIELCDGPKAGPYCQSPQNCTAPNPYVSYCSCPGGSILIGTTCRKSSTGTRNRQVALHDINPCSLEPCQHNAICTDAVSSYTCQCTPGFTGVNCETALGCSSNPCQNGGRCAEGDNSYRCLCPANYGGIKCELAQTHCAERKVIAAQPYRVGDLTEGYDFSEANASCIAAGARMVQSRDFYNTGPLGKCLQDFVFGALVKSKIGYESETVQFWLDACSASACNLITVTNGGSRYNVIVKLGSAPKSYSYIPAAICELASTG